MGQVRTFQLTKALGLLTVLENMKLGATGQRGEHFWASLFPAIWRKQDAEIQERAMGLLTSSSSTRRPMTSRRASRAVSGSCSRWPAR